MKLHFLYRKLQCLCVGHTFKTSILYSKISPLINKNWICDLKDSIGTHMTELISFWMFEVGLRSFVGFLTFDPHCFTVLCLNVCGKPPPQKALQARLVPHSACLLWWMTHAVCKDPVGWHPAYRSIRRCVCWVRTLSLFVTDTNMNVYCFILV